VYWIVKDSKRFMTETSEVVGSHFIITWTISDLDASTVRADTRKTAKEPEKHFSEQSEYQLSGMGRQQ